MDGYEATRRRHIEHLLPQIGEHFERVAWSADRLQTERTVRLRAHPDCGMPQEKLERFLVL